jgi:hypothetical protein
LIISGYRLDYSTWGQLEFGENSRAFRLTLSENKLGLSEKSLITAGAAQINGLTGNIAKPSITIREMYMPCLMIG